MLYKLDLRLKEITQKETVPFGGVSLFCFGDLMQLKPVLARWIFAQPMQTSFQLPYAVDPLFRKMSSINLITNHRQKGDKLYGDLLNRLRISEHTEADLQALRSRILPRNSPDLPNDALVISCINREVNAINRKKLDTLSGNMLSITADVYSTTQKKMKPLLDPAGSVKNTPLQNVLNLKIDAKVTLTYNLDTSDSLTNGAMGKVVDFLYNSNGEIREILVEFNNECCGKNLRDRNKYLLRMYPGQLVTPIQKMEFNYNISKKSSTSTSGVAVQFPLKLAFASTCHKIQGMTIKKPNKLVVDLKDIREAAQAYVMFSRVQELDQLYILDDLHEEKIYHSFDAMDAVNRLTESCRKTFCGISSDKIVLTSLNIRSLDKNFQTLVVEQRNFSSNIICLQETWVVPEQAKEEQYQLEGMQFTNNSIGKGKGVAGFLGNAFVPGDDIQTSSYQVSSYCSDSKVIVNLYISNESAGDQFKTDLIKIISSHSNKEIEMFVVGDFNIDFNTESYHHVIQKLKELGFDQLVRNATHEAGRQIDHIYVRNPTCEYKVIHQSLPYLDHDVLHVISK